jgi:CelD/BcsL family acetyltransferase involved in cellulose biosynthesis
LESKNQSIWITRYSDSSDFIPLEPFWNDLLRRSSVDDPFLTFDWQYSWWKHYGEGKELWLLVAREGECLVGILPLMLIPNYKRGFQAKILYLVGRGDIDHGGFIVPEGRGDVAAAFGEYLAANDRTWDIFQLNNIRKDGQDLKPFFDALPNSKFTIEITQESSHYFLPLDGKWEDIQKRLPDRLRRMIKNRGAQFSNQMQGRFVNLTGTHIAMNEFNALLETARKGRYSHLYETDNDCQFHQTLVSTMGSKGWIGVTLLYLDEKIIAYRYGFLYQNKFFDWRTGYDPQFSDLSPGTLLLGKSIEQFVNMGLQEFDFLRGESAYKQQWTAQTRSYLNYQIVRRWRWSELIFVRLPAWKSWINGLIHKSV